MDTVVTLVHHDIMTQPPGGGYMIRFYTWALTAFFVFAVLFCGPATAKEDTAQITLKKTAVSKQNLHKYTVKKGDVISAIIRRIPGITEEDIPDNYRIIKQLNPNIPDLNKLYVGQILVLPGKDPGVVADNKDETKTAALDTPTSSEGSRTYMIKRGDNLTRIIYRELKIKTATDLINTLRLVRSLNPRIVNINMIYAGQSIKLPDKAVIVHGPQVTEKALIESAESRSQEDQKVKTTEKKIMTPQERLAVIKHVIGQMNGSISSSGNYYLPIPKTGQMTIDCAKIPVIEFDDQTTVFLDQENRLSDDLKKVISDNWKNFHVVNVDKKDDLISILRKIIASTNSYGMTKREKPVSAGSSPPVEIIVDWIIVKADSRHTTPLLQGLRLISTGNPLLPKSIKNYAQKNGLIITEIDLETGVTGKPEEIYSLPPLPVIPATPIKDFSYELVTHLGFTAAKDADIKVFDMAKDGFNLSIKADVLIRNMEKPCIIYSHSLPQQFIDVLKKAGNNLVLVTDSDSPKIAMEKILRGLAIPYASGYFTFSGVDKNQAPYMFGFTGTKIKTDKDQYFIDFQLDDGLRSLIAELWSANIARY
jgi:LysM repeat protein